MKKFSKITNIATPTTDDGNVAKGKENSRSKSTRQDEKREAMKFQILELMDRYLAIRAHGSIDHRYISGSVTIAGKEMVAEAILDTIEGRDGQEAISLLEGLKSKANDWLVIDNEIDKIRNGYKPGLDHDLLKTHKKWESIVNKYGHDVGLMENYIQSSLSGKIDNRTADIYLKLLENLDIDKESKSRLGKILNDCKS
jgi:hypothetical protein